jgi:uncharacterized radical SAM superfamily Fe-S cluster-containing enzyme
MENGTKFFAADGFHVSRALRRSTTFRAARDLRAYNAAWPRPFMMRLPIVDIARPAQTAGPAAPAATFDTGPRSISAVRVLRISVTDRCNFRCVYCMPEEGVRWLPKADILSFEEIADVCRAAIGEHGIRRFKLTGGEPTIRHGIVDLVAQLRPDRGHRGPVADDQRDAAGVAGRPLREAGLDRVTVSIDSLDAGPLPRDHADRANWRLSCAGSTAAKRSASAD